MPVAHCTQCHALRRPRVMVGRSAHPQHGRRLNQLVCALDPLSLPPAHPVSSAAGTAATTGDSEAVEAVVDPLLRGKAVSALQGRLPGPFSAADLRFWAEYGYVMLHDAVPAARLQAVVDEAFDYLDMSESDPESWYARPPRVGGPVEPGDSPHHVSGIMQMQQAQSEWDTRQDPRIHAAFAQLCASPTLLRTVVLPPEVSPGCCLC